MLYFILWAVFLLGVILAVPIASWIEKKKLRAALAAQEEPIDEQVDDGQEDGEIEAEAEEEGGDVEMEAGAFEAFEEEPAQ